MFVHSGYFHIAFNVIIQVKKFMMIPLIPSITPMTSLS